MSLQEVFGEEELITQYINGSYENEQLSNTISIGLSGEIIAISEPSNVQNGIERNLVRVYQKQTDLLGASSWNQYGNTIYLDNYPSDMTIHDTGDTISISHHQVASNNYTYTVTAGSVFDFYGEEYSSDTHNPVLTFKRGSTYILNINTTSLHSFTIQKTNNNGEYDSANVYNNGVTNNGIYDGIITFVVPMDAPDTLYYCCSNYGNMGNSISIVTEPINTITNVFKYDISWNQVSNNNGSGIEGDWLYNYSTSNALKSIYMKGMLEMDNATLRTRNEDNNLIGSVDASFNGGNVYLGETMKIGTETIKPDITLDVSGNTNISGNLKIIGDLSAISQITVDHVDISGDLITSGDDINISSQNVTYDSELIITDAPLNVNKSKLSASAGKEAITLGNVLTTGNYSQIGETIYGYPAHYAGVYTQYYGTTDMNDAGDIIIIGYGYSSAQLARVYQYMTISQDDYNSGNTTGSYDNTDGEIIIANGVAWSADTKFWVQLGGDIDNSFINSLGSSQTAAYAGNKVSINGTGDTIAVGAYGYDAFGDNNGAVFVLKYSTPGQMGGSWSLVGNIIGVTLLTETAIQLGNKQIQLSQDGKTLLVTSNSAVDTTNMPTAMKNQEDAGDYVSTSPVCIFQYRTVTESEFNAGNTTTYDPNDGTPVILANSAAWSAENEYWVQLGNYIYMPYSSYAADCVRMSEDGYRVMIGSSTNTVSANSTGSIHVFEYSNPGSITGLWNRIGGVIFGDATTGAGLTRTAYMSKDGNVVAFGQMNSDYTTASSTSSEFGVVRAMEYRLVSQTEWDNAKKAASGDIVTSQGVPLIYPDGDTNLNTTKKYWIQMGADVMGHLNSGNDDANWCLIENTYNGYMLSIFSRYADVGKIYKFTTVSESEFNSRTYDNSNDSNVLFTNGESWESDKKFWVQIGDAFNLSSTDDYFMSMVFSRDGTKLLCSEAYNAHTYSDGSTTTAGAIYVYEFDTEQVSNGYNYQGIVTDVSMVSAAESFGEDVSLNPALSVPGNILIVDSSNSEYNYGSYTIHTDKDYTNYFAVGKSASDVFNIVNNNNAGVYMSSSANSFTGTSDERLKKNVCDIEDKDLENLQHLRPVSYKWKKQTDDTEHYGFIAQEVEKYLPNLVDENTCPDGSTYKGVAVDDLIPYMIKYIQKLKKKIAEKEKEMET